MQKEIRGLVNFIKEEVEMAGKDGCVVGLSGGIDSAVIASLCRVAFPNSTLGVSMPAKADLESTKRAKLLAWVLDIEFLLDSVEFNQHYFNKNRTILQFNELAEGNYVARMRMAKLYFHAETTNRLVIGTDNKCENYLGYFTKYGDGGVDLNPLGQYYKSEVVAIAKELGDIPSEIINAVPSAELYDGHTDEKELGMTYDEIELAINILEKGLCCVKENHDAVIKTSIMHQYTKHKRNLPKVYERIG